MDLMVRVKNAYHPFNEGDILTVEDIGNDFFKILDGEYKDYNIHHSEFEVIGEYCDKITHADICDKLNSTYKAKNEAYGDSFGKSFREFGIISAIVRLEDKWNRIKALTKGAENNVHDESIKDTLLDMANYCIMTLLELDNNDNSN